MLAVVILRGTSLKTELKNKLCSDYPELFQPRYGIDIDDGWFDLINELCGKIVALHPNIHMGYMKEKYGTLRLDVRCEGSVPEAIRNQAYKLEMEYEEKSGSICEICGERGMLRGGSWLRTLCDSDAASKGYGSIEDMP